MRIRKTAVAVAMSITSLLALGACTPDQMKAWWDANGIDHSMLSEQEVAGYADLATELWEAPPSTTTTTAAPAYVPHCVIPEYICRRESGFSYTALNRSSGAGGMYQFLPSTWNSIARSIAPQWVGTAPNQAPPAVQDQFATWLWNGGRGCSHWSAC